MEVVVVLPAPALPQSTEGFYSINNPFQKTGPKGFTEFKILDNDDLFWRIDLPGVPKHYVTLSIDPSTKKSVNIDAFAPSLDTKDPRKYTMACTLFCNCCKIEAFDYVLSDGVLRLIVSKTFIDEALNAKCPYRFPQSSDLNGDHMLFKNSDPNDPALTGPELQPHPGVKQGPTMAYESTQFRNGSVYVRVDMPGVPKDKFRVTIKDGRVKVSGQAPAISHDSAGRYYSGDVAKLSAHVDLPMIDRILPFGKLGVFYLDIFPPLFSTLLSDDKRNLNM